MRCAIIDDDLIVREILKGFIEQTDGLKLVHNFDSATKAIQILEKNPVDLIFLDMQMPQMNGLDFLKTYQNNSQIIVVSAESEYAVSSYEFAVADYLLKPIEYSRFYKAIKKVKASSKDLGGSIFIKSNSQFIKLDFKHIKWIEAYGDYVKIETDQATHTVYSTLKKIQDKLPADKFVKAHRSYLINVDRVTGVSGSSLEFEEDTIPVSNSYKDSILQIFNTL